MSNGIAPFGGQIQPRYGWDEIQQMAEATAKSGLFRMTAPQILVLMMIAESEGVHPVRALLMYDIIDGRPALKATTMAAKFQQAGGVIEWLQTTSEAAEALFSHRTSCPNGVQVRYTIDDAKLAGLTHKDNWKKDPGSMVVARCISRGVRRCLPGVIMGIYEPDEVEEAQAAPPEQAARSDLVNRLKARRETKPVVIDTKTVESETRAAEPPAVEVPPKPSGPKDPSTEWGKWLAGEVEELNVEREKLAQANPAHLDLRKRITVKQVVNHLIKISEGQLSEDDLKTDGKRDPKKVADMMGNLWAFDAMWCQDEARGYLAELMGKLITEPSAAP